MIRALALILMAASAHAPGPVAGVRAYLSALNHHDPAAVCATFAPALRAFERHFDNPTLHPVSCPAAVAGHFSSYYSDRRWKSARIVRVRSVSVDRRGIAAVVLTLDHRYVCAPPRTSPCRAGDTRRPDIIYLTRVAGAWRVVKPGLVFRATELPSPEDSALDWYPPGDARTVARPVGDMGSVRCPATGATARQLDPVPTAPWLSIRRLTVTRLARGRTCFALRLGARPRPDSSYDLSAGPVARAAPYDVYSVQFDGIGGVHMLWHGRSAFGDPLVAPHLPSIAVHGNELDVLAPPDRQLSGRRYLVDARASSLQLGDPLLAHPFLAADSGAPDGACLVVPTGRLDRAGNCAAVPSG